jgi:transcription antitermination protein NusB
MSEPLLSGSNKARELAFRVLFSSEQGKHSINVAWSEAKLDLQHALDDALDPETEEGMLEASTESLNPEAIAFAHRLLLGYDEYRDHVDQTLQRVIEGWTFSQMSQTDLAILRLASFEILHLPTPAAVAIEIAVRLAKRYGGDDSSKFVNGVLARLLEREASPEKQANKGRKARKKQASNP